MFCNMEFSSGLPLTKVTLVRIDERKSFPAEYTRKVCGIRLSVEILSGFCCYVSYDTDIFFLIKMPNIYQTWVHRKLRKLLVIFIVKLVNSRAH